MAARAGVDPDGLRRRAQEAVLSVVRRGADGLGLIDALSPHQLEGACTPDLAMLAVTALDAACPAGWQPPLEAHAVPAMVIYTPAAAEGLDVAVAEIARPDGLAAAR
jgi:hypothetical protein